MQVTNIKPAMQGKTRSKEKISWSLFFMALPLMALVVLFRYIPLFGWVLSLFEYKPGTPLFKNTYVGLKYFQMFFTSRDTIRVLVNTFVFSGISFCALILPLLMAVLLNEIGSARFRKLSQTMTTLPHFISWIIVYSIAFNIFGSEGLINQVRAFFGAKTSQLGVLNDMDSVYWFQSLLTIWKTLGWNAIIYIAAITGIDQELYEAATVDGAGKFRCALHITIPSLMPTFIVLMLLCVSNFINVGMEQYYVFKNTFVYDRIEVLDVYTYRVGLQLYDYSYATAIGIFKSTISVIMLFIANTVAKLVRGQGIV